MSSRGSRRPGRARRHGLSVGRCATCLTAMPPRTSTSAPRRPRPSCCSSSRRPAPPASSTGRSWCSTGAWPWSARHCGATARRTATGAIRIAWRSAAASWRTSRGVTSLRTPWPWTQESSSSTTRSGALRTAWRGHSAPWAGPPCGCAKTASASCARTGSWARAAAAVGPAGSTVSSRRRSRSRHRWWPGCPASAWWTSCGAY
mmetsp:Transcript_106305/g.300770  ORF Transcript_106305/g.300770 Transcript_106305/m.300770 type:complete len:203 (+) Transcript_106305:319-927(+)